MTSRCKRQAGFVTWAALAMQLALSPFVIGIGTRLEASDIRSVTSKESRIALDSIAINVINESIEDQELRPKIDQSHGFRGDLLRFRQKDESPLPWLEFRSSNYSGLFDHLAYVEPRTTIRRHAFLFEEHCIDGVSHRDIDVRANIFGCSGAHICENKKNAAILFIATYLYASNFQSREVGFVELFECKSRTSSSALSNLKGVIHALTHQFKLMPEKPSLNAGNKQRAKSDESSNTGVLNKRRIDRLLLLAFVSFLLGFCGIFLGCYLAFDKKRLFLGSALLCLGLLIPGYGLWQWLNW